MIGDQHLHAERLRRLDPRESRNTVVHGDQEVGALALEVRDQDRGESITVLHAVRDAKIHVGMPEAAQLAQHQRRTRGPVRIEVADDQDAGAPPDVLQQQRRRRQDAVQRRHRQQPAQFERQLVRIPDPACGIDTTQHRVQRPGQRIGGARRPPPDHGRRASFSGAAFHRRS